MPAAKVPVQLTIENPAAVFALNRFAGMLPASEVVMFAPSILTEPAVGTFPAPATLSVVGSPPAFQFQAT